MINDIIPFDPEHYDHPDVKPEPWRQEWKDYTNDRRSSLWKNELVVTRIDPFSYETTSLKRYNGESPQGALEVPSITFETRAHGRRPGA
jgi:hypothetical protein